MARVPGRDNRIAVPFLLVSTAVVALLVWLAIPGLPLVLGWAGGAAGTTAAILAATPTPQVALADNLDVSAADCRELYPTDLWNELTWTVDVVLTQSTTASSTALTDLTAALAPTASRTCLWRDGDDRSIVTTFATVSATDAVGLTEAALRGQGFACETVDGVLSCTAQTAAGDERQMLKGTLWVSTVGSAWSPDGYDERIAAHLWR